MQDDEFHYSSESNIIEAEVSIEQLSILMAESYQDRQNMVNLKKSAGSIKAKYSKYFDYNGKFVRIRKI